MLWYKAPANEWVESLPIGNGRLGGMVYGGVKQERISLNEDTLWSGMPSEADNAEVVNYLEKTRELIFAEKYREAQTIIENHMLGPWSSSYQAMGDLQIEFLHGLEVIDYRRELNLRTAITSTEYKSKGVCYYRESFISSVDQVMVVRLESDTPAGIDFEASLTSPLQHTVFMKTKEQIVLQGKAPSIVEPLHDPSEQPVIYEEGKGMSFQMNLLVLPEGGRVEAHGARLLVKSANAVTLLFSAATSFNGFDKDPVLEGKDPAKLSEKWLNEATNYSYEELKSRHIADHQSFFDRVELELDVRNYESIPTDERILAVRDGKIDDQLAILFFNFGRYLLITSSRPGTQPSNLQGIWNNKTRPPWTSNNTTNINTEMNYWLTETCNLPELSQPLFDMLKDLQVAGGKMVDVYYKCRGWTAHHGVDLWRTAAPQGAKSKGPASWAYWPMTGPWLCQHLWEHYAFSGSKEFLQNTAYPLIKGVALFCLDYLVEDSEGNLVSVPSTSPENTFIGPDGVHAAVSISSTLDIALMKDLFTYCIDSSEILGVDEEFRNKLIEARERLLPLKIGKHGQLQEWYKDFDEAEPGHRHTAHLYALHPSNQITPRSTPELARAARVTLDRRRVYEGTDTIGWCFAWNICFYARLEEPEMAYEYLTKLVANPFPNLFNAHRHPKLKEYPLTVEANFGATAGIAEMLLQSHDQCIHLLPAIPKAWKKGKIKGLRARGGYEIDMEWDNGKVIKTQIKALNDGLCRIRTDYIPGIVNEEFIIKDGIIEIKAKAGKTYLLEFKD
ncbi:alpha/beta hydrolase [Paenibacillus abyssi]|uniref:Alpha/beta hydrolase n=2 Tax=Paenibacillus abyssi TaxID=1340531 RepID=A0A917FTJ2_9BACL|nr:alpha/beta hydrolase [Paenibacillus abyssi]